MVTCVVCGKGIQVSLRSLLHPPSSDGSRAVRDFYVTHLNPLLDTSITQKMFACRRPCFVKLEQALKHTAKANTIITELKATHPGTGVTDSDSSTARGTSSMSSQPDFRWCDASVQTNVSEVEACKIIKKRVHSQSAVTGSTPKRPRFTLSAGKGSKRSQQNSGIWAPEPKRARLELQMAKTHSVQPNTISTPETGAKPQEATPSSVA